MSARKRSPNYDPPESYWSFSREPMQALIFLLPLLLVYELGVIFFVNDNAPSLLAQVWLDRFFERFGATGFHFAPLAVVGVLLGWHFARGDRLEFDWQTYVVMLAESILFAAPLLVFGLLLAPRNPMAATLAATGAGDWRIDFVQSIGAGIYEELMFRLIAIAIIHALLVDLLKFPETWGAVAAIALSSLAFALVHFPMTNWDAFEEYFRWSRFFFLFAGGVYLAFVYLLRGFGIVVGAHAMYDIFVLILQAKAAAAMAT